MFKLSTIGLAFALAALAFWTTMLTDPPKTEASVGSAFAPVGLVIQSSLPEAEAADAH